MSALYVVGTPIGNLKDITLRALEVLKFVDVIACEDTRTSMKLLQHYQISKPLISYHKYNETERSEEIIDMIINGKNVAIISDAGMPGICDPGAVVIRKCRDKGINVSIIPGVSATTSAFSWLGSIYSGFTFLGFLPEKMSDRKNMILNVQSLTHPFILYVAPHDIKNTVSFLLSILGNRECFVARELTKLHEELVQTSLASFNCTEKGEMVLIVLPANKSSEIIDMTIKDALMFCISKGMDKKDAIKFVAKEKNITKNDVYTVAITLD